MSKNNDVFVDYKQIKTRVSIIMVLDHYGWLRRLKGTGNTVRSCCPIHNGSNDKQFVVNIRNNTWCSMALAMTTCGAPHSRVKIGFSSIY